MDHFGPPTPVPAHPWDPAVLGLNGVHHSGPTSGGVFPTEKPGNPPKKRR